MLHTCLKLVLLQILLISSTACFFFPPHGQLLVHSKHKGYFEIYRSGANSNSELIADSRGEYNRALSLEEGKYWVMADCSVKEVQVLHGSTVELYAKKLFFEHPIVDDQSNPPSNDSLVVSCSRTIEEFLFHQSFKGKYSLDVLATDLRLLIGMQEYKLTVRADTEDEKVQLSSFRVRTLRAKKRIHEKYYIWPRDSKAVATQGQYIDKWVHVLPGAYSVMVNGTQLDVEVGEQDHQEVYSKNFLVKNDDNSQSYFLNKDKGVYDFNTSYEVISNGFNIYFNGSKYPFPIDLKYRSSIVVSPKSVEVVSECPYWEVGCRSRKKIAIFEDGQQYPVQEGKTDKTLYYLGGGKQLSIVGSQDLKYYLNSQQRKTIKTGVVSIEPLLEHISGTRTEFIQIKALSPEFSGSVMDLDINSRSQLTLIQGLYKLTVFSEDRVSRRRFKSSKIFYVGHGRPAQVSFRRFVSLDKSRRSRQKKDVKAIRRARYLRKVGETLEIQ